MQKKIDCSVLTPERTLYEDQIDFAAVQAYDGEIGFLVNHAPLLSELGIGEIRLKTKDKIDYLVVEGGIVEIRENKLIILAENAYTKEELNPVEIKSKLSQLENQTEKSKFLKMEMKKLKIRLKVLDKK